MLSAQEGTKPIFGTDEWVFCSSAGEDGQGVPGRAWELKGKGEIQGRIAERYPLGLESHSGQTALKKSSPKVMTLIWVVHTLQMILELGDRTRILAVLLVFFHQSVPTTHLLVAFTKPTVQPHLGGTGSPGRRWSTRRVMLPLGRCPSHKDRAV